MVHRMHPNHSNKLAVSYLSQPNFPSVEKDVKDMHFRVRDNRARAPKAMLLNRTPSAQMLRCGTQVMETLEKERMSNRSSEWQDHKNVPLEVGSSLHWTVSDQVYIRLCHVSESHHAHTSQVLTSVRKIASEMRHRH